MQRTPRAAALADARAEAEAVSRGPSIRDPRCRHGLRRAVVVGRDTLSHWLEKGGGHMPGLDEVVAAIDALQHERTRRAAPGPVTRRGQTDGSAG